MCFLVQDVKPSSWFRPEGGRCSGSRLPLSAWSSGWPYSSWSRFLSPRITPGLSTSVRPSRCWPQRPSASWLPRRHAAPRWGEVLAVFGGAAVVLPFLFVVCWPIMQGIVGIGDAINGLKGAEGGAGLAIPFLLVLLLVLLVVLLLVLGPVVCAWWLSPARSRPPSRPCWRSGAVRSPRPPGQPGAAPDQELW